MRCFGFYAPVFVLLGFLGSTRLFWFYRCHSFACIAFRMSSLIVYG